MASPASSIPPTSSSSPLVGHGEKRETWSSRTAFLLAAIGAAVGFGNVWRFPALVYNYGGGAFFLPYILALVLVGIPLLVQEVAMGQHLRIGDVGVSSSIHKNLRGVGLASVFCGFVVVTYYVPLIAWCMRAFFESFGRMSDDWEDINGSEASEYFFHEVVGTSTLDEDMRPTRLVLANIFYLGVTWVIVGMCLSFGIKWTGRIAYITMGLPILMLAILLVRALTLPGSSTGIQQYIGHWDWSVLVNKPDVWSTAVSQIFFSVGVAFGVMTAFGSHCEPNAPAFENSLVIAIANSSFSILSGFCVYGILGYLATIEGEFEVKAGVALLFGAYPAGLSTIPYGLWWVRFLFFNLILLGLDSAFALVEAVVSVIEDSVYNKLEKQKLVAAICVLGFLSGILYTTDAALHFLDVIDFYVNFIILFLGFCKSFSAGWVYGIDKQIQKFGKDIVYAYIASTFGSLFLASLIWFGLQGRHILLGSACYMFCYGIGRYYCLHKMNELLQSYTKPQTIEALQFELTMGNVLDLKRELESSVGYIPYAWAVLMKHFIPQVLLVLFFNLAFTRTEEEEKWEFGNYGNYMSWPFQFLGVSCVIITALIVGVGFIKTNIYDGFAPETEATIPSSTSVSAGENNTAGAPAGGVGSTTGQDDKDDDAVVELSNYANMDTLDEDDTPGGAAVLL